MYFCLFFFFFWYNGKFFVLCSCAYLLFAHLSFLFASFHTICVQLCIWLCLFHILFLSYTHTLSVVYLNCVCFFSLFPFNHQSFIEINLVCFYFVSSFSFCRKSFFRRIKDHSALASLAAPTIRVYHLVQMNQAFSYHM